MSNVIRQSQLLIHHQFTGGGEEGRPDQGWRFLPAAYTASRMSQKCCNAPLAITKKHTTTYHQEDKKMEPYKLGEMEQKFADLIWEHAPSLPASW